MKKFREWISVRIAKSPGPVVLVGIVLALLAVFGVDKALNLSAKLGIPTAVSDLGGLLLFALIILTVLKFTVWKKRDKKA